MELGAYRRGEEVFFKEVCRGELHSLISEGFFITEGRRFLSQRGGGFLSQRKGGGFHRG
jgi:hypothetical protein